MKYVEYFKSETVYVGKRKKEKNKIIMKFFLHLTKK